MENGPRYLDMRTKTLGARGWVDCNSGKDTWRVLDVASDGFRYDGPGFFAPRWKSFADHFPEAWARWASGASAES